MPLVAAAILPHPPLIVPELAAGAAAELDDLRAACDQAVTRVLAAEPAVVCVLGSGAETTEYWFPYRASFAAWGIPVEAHLGVPRADTPALPLSVAVGVWLLRRQSGQGHPAGQSGQGPAGQDVESPASWRVCTVAGAEAPRECTRLGERICHGPSTGLLVMGDGSACRNLKAPGYFDSRAEPFDATVVEALATADPARLLTVDPVLATELMVAGRAPWQVLAGAAAGRTWTGDLLYDDVLPLGGVQYTVATWLPR